VTDDEKTSPTDDESRAEESSTAVELTEPSSANAPADPPVAAAPANAGRSLPRRARSAARRKLGAILVVTALVLSAGLAAWVYFFEYRVDQATDEAVADEVLESAKEGTIALLSYSPDSLDEDFAAAKSNLTGDFLSYYTQFTEQIVTPAAREKQVRTEAAVVRAGVMELHPTSAQVLVFINQVTTSKENPDGAFAASSVKVGLTKVDDRWLIDAFDPV